MTLPVGVTTCAVTVGTPFATSGTDGTLKVTVAPDFGGYKHIIWAATGDTYENWPEEYPAGDDVSAVSIPVPHVNQAGWLAPDGSPITGWAYNVTVTAKLGNATNKYPRRISPLTGTTTADLELLADAAAADPTLGDIPFEGFFARRNLIPAARVRTWGHSYMHGSGTGVTPGSNDMATLIARGLDLPLDNQSVSGSALYNHLSIGDWADVLQYETRPTRFAALGGVYALMYGINDTAYLGLTQAALLPYRHALRATIARLRAAAVFEDSDTTVTYGGSGAWVAGSGAGGNSGAGFHFNATSGATFTVTTPSNFPGGTMVLGFIAWNDGSSGTVTGPSSLSSPSINVADFAGTDCRRTGVLRVHNVPAGSGAYVFTTSAVTGTTGVVFDWWGWEPDEAACPIVAVIGQPKPLDYTAQSAAAFPGTDAGMDALNAVQQAVVAEFGARVLYVDTTALDKSATYFVAGNIHPNAAGHAYIATRALAAIETLRPQFLPADLNGAGAAPVTGWQNYTPTLGGVTVGSGLVQASFRNAGDNVVDFYARITLAADSSVTGPVTVSLPSGAANAYATVNLDAVLLHSGTSYYLAAALLLALDTITVRTIGTAGALANLSSTVPFTWGTGDFIEISGCYRKA